MKRYRLIGFLNLFDMVPDFVYPVFENDGLYYFQDEKNGKIIDFVLVKSSVYSMITKIDKCKQILGIKKAILEIGSKSVFAFQIEKSKVVCGEDVYMFKFFQRYIAENEFIRKEIAVFKEELSNSEEVNKYREKQLVREHKSVGRTYRFYGTGRRKKSIARVYLAPGKGDIVINKRPIDEYFELETLKIIVRQPFVATDTIDKYDVWVNVRGGSHTGQASAIRHGIARALLQVDADYRSVLKKAGFLTRDPRMKERKKYGLKAGRRVPQFRGEN